MAISPKFHYCTAIRPTPGVNCYLCITKWIANNTLCINSLTNRQLIIVSQHISKSHPEISEALSYCLRARRVQNLQPCAFHCDKVVSFNTIMIADATAFLKRR